MNNDFNLSSNLNSLGIYKHKRVRRSRQDFQSIDPQVHPSVAANILFGELISFINFFDIEFNIFPKAIPKINMFEVRPKKTAKFCGDFYSFLICFAAFIKHVVHFFDKYFHPIITNAFLSSAHKNILFHLSKISFTSQCNKGAFII
jgi:hypothetical protein